MTTKEFSNEFDVLLNSHSGITVELDEYEKSVLLTEAQEEVIKGLYKGTFTGESLEKTEELRRCLDSLIKTDQPESIVGDLTGLDKKSSFYKLKSDVWFITYESVELVNDAYCKDSPVIRVVPMRQDEWHRARNNPFRKPNKRKVVRLDNGSNIIELISDYPIQKYLIRYISKPAPIILVPLEGDLFINETQEVTECKLNTVLHRTILERAVELASRRIPASK